MKPSVKISIWSTALLALCMMVQPLQARKDKKSKKSHEFMLVIGPDGMVRGFKPAYQQESRVIIPEKTSEGVVVRSLARNAFKDRTTLMSVELPASLQSLGGGAFVNTRISSLEVPEGVTSLAGIGGNNPDLKRVVLPASLKEIRQYLFWNCPGLKDVIVNAVQPPKFVDKPQMAYTLFGPVSPRQNIKAIVSPNLRIKVPATSVEAYKKAPGWSTYAKFIEAQ